MHYKLVDEKPKTFILVFETNDELARGLRNFASEQKLASASFKAIGALSSVRHGEPGSPEERIRSRSWYRANQALGPISDRDLAHLMEPSS